MAVLAERVPELRTALVAVADPDRAPAMAAYMRGRYEYLGVTAPDRKRAAKPFVAAGSTATAGELLDAADACWAQPEREFQYVAVDLLRRWVGRLDGTHLARIERLIRTSSWWDTVDALAADVVGPIVAADPLLGSVMDEWIDDDDLWIARTAILHQLTYRDGTDSARLFDAVDRRGGDTEFFIRKACGWALRQLARYRPDEVRAYVERRGDRLSGLTRREALKHL